MMLSAKLTQAHPCMVVGCPPHRPAAMTRMTSKFNESEKQHVNSYADVQGAWMTSLRW